MCRHSFLRWLIVAMVSVLALAGAAMGNATHRATVASAETLARHNVLQIGPALATPTPTNTLDPCDSADPPQRPTVIPSLHPSITPTVTPTFAPGPVCWMGVTSAEATVGEIFEIDWWDGAGCGLTGTVCWDRNMLQAVDLEGNPAQSVEIMSPPLGPYGRIDANAVDHACGCASISARADWDQPVGEPRIVAKLRFRALAPGWSHVQVFYGHLLEADRAGLIDCDSDPMTDYGHGSVTVLRPGWTPMPTSAPNAIWLPALGN